MNKLVRILLGLVALAIALWVALMLGLPRQEAFIIVVGAPFLALIAIGLLGKKGSDS